MEPTISPSPERQCQQCGRPLKGRTDKRFCNDDCRNQYNREKRQKINAQAAGTIPDILRIIRRNYQILLENFDFNNDSTVIYRADASSLLEQGFNDKFCTSIEFINGELWKFCFDRGWCINQNSGHLLIQWNPYHATP